ncbi:M24 family metallopeptidase [Sediminimonas qiaohouensis]|uniref:M24 family metallopeptidase n=1 Tax=Sediminimonas qiaohouensis TaxID=552061 RepID=UPI002353CA16|nr:Xaa-Pro peptidase family protein [Sediminimonas qiaohouensis]
MDVPGAFDPGEYAARLSRAQAGMARAGIGALLLTTEAEVRYFTGFLTRFWESPSRPWYLVVPAQGASVAVIPEIGAPLMTRTGLADIRTWSAPDPADDGTALLAEALREVAGTGRIGVPMGPETHLRMPLADFERLKTRIGLRFGDDAGIMAGLRAIKSEAEIARIRETCAVAGRAFARVPEIAAAGVPLDQVFRDFQRLLLEEGADWVPYLAGGAGPDGYGDVISPAGARRLAAGDVMMLDTGAVRGGYFCDFDRNFAVGPVPDAVRRAHATLMEACEAGLSLAQPGARACDLFEAMAAVTGARAGRLGHGLGMQLTEGLSLSKGDPTVLEPGMVITLEPWIALSAGSGMVHEENIVIREGAAEVLSPWAGSDLPEV